MRLERWFLKTLINLGASNSTSGTWSATGQPLDLPPVPFIEAAFGKSKLEQPLGLYGVATIGESIVPANAVEVQTLIKEDQALAGALFTFLGFRFFLNLEQGNIPPSAPLPSRDGWVESSLLYHVTRLENKVGKKLSHYIHVLWNVP